MGRGQGASSQHSGTRRGAAITPDVNALYMAGACRAFAVALHDQTGWPLVVVTDADNVFDPKVQGASLSEDERQEGVIGRGSLSPRAIHALVEHPSGELIDIQGGNDPMGLVEAYDGAAEDGRAALGYVDRESLLEEHEGTSAGVHTTDEAARYVPEVLRLVAADAAEAIGA